MAVGLSLIIRERDDEAMEITKNKVTTIFFILICAAMLVSLLILIINAHIKALVKGRILSPDHIPITDADCILVLGARVWADGSPSYMLEDRLVRAIELYNMGICNRLLMSGDHGKKDYDEVNVMKKYAVDRGIPSSCVFMDHAGFSTYESLYRARDVFKVKKAIIVTQEYHLYRALYIAQKLGLEAYGVAADRREYYGQSSRELREILARVKDFFAAIIKPKPTYLGDPIPIDGDGDLTND